MTEYDEMLQVSAILWQNFLSDRLNFLQKIGRRNVIFVTAPADMKLGRVTQSSNL